MCSHHPDDRLKQNARPGLILLLVLCAAASAAPVTAQDAGSLVITPPDSSDFPQLTFILDLHDSGGNFISPLLPSHVEIHEDDSPTPIKPDSIARLEPGMQIMLAFNPGITMLYPATGGQTRFQVLRGALQTWAGSRPAGPVSYTLLTLPTIHPS